MKYNGFARVDERSVKVATKLCKMTVPRRFPWRLCIGCMPKPRDTNGSSPTRTVVVSAERLYFFLN